MGRTGIEFADYLGRVISTHSPRVGRTAEGEWRTVIAKDFNSLAPCGANLTIMVFPTIPMRFQLTRPVWGEPYSFLRLRRVRRDFNSLAPCGANLFTLFRFFAYQRFQLTRPVWGEPLPFRAYALIWNISTHSPRVGRTNSLQG